MDPVEVRANFAFFNLVSRSGAKQRSCLLKSACTNQIKAVHQLAYNILFNNSIELTEAESATVKKNLTAMKLLSSKKVPIKDKKELLVKSPRLAKFLCQVGEAYLTDYL
jgi:hypothetical protein